MIKYRCQKESKYEYGPFYKDIDLAIKAVQEDLAFGRAVEMSLMPGDATHYRLLITSIDNGLRVRYESGDWSVDVSSILSPSLLAMKVGHGINPFTAGVICDVINRIRGTSATAYYDWVNALPLEEQ